MARLFLAGLLFAMAAGQLSNPAGFVDIVASYGIGGTALGAIGAAALIACELVAGRSGCRSAPVARGVLREGALLLVSFGGGSTLRGRNARPLRSPPGPCELGVRVNGAVTATP